MNYREGQAALGVIEDREERIAHLEALIKQLRENECTRPDCTFRTRTKVI